VSVTTYGAPAMTGENIGLIGFFEKDSTFPDLSGYYCLIHEQALCTKNDRFSRCDECSAKKIVNLICARPLQHRLFRHLLEMKLMHILET
jgi:hypothetical protein